jgi:hypothetical protein
MADMFGDVGSFLTKAAPTMLLGAPGLAFTAANEAMGGDLFGGAQDALFGGTETGEFMPTVQQVNPFTAQFQQMLTGLTEQQTPAAFQQPTTQGPDALAQFQAALPLAQQQGQAAAALQAPSGQRAADLASAAQQGQAASLFQGLGGAESGAAKAALAQGAMMPQLQFQQQQNQLQQSVQNQVLQQLLGQQMGAAQLGLGQQQQNLAQQAQQQGFLGQLLGLGTGLAAPEFIGSQMTQEQTPGLFDTASAIAPFLPLLSDIRLKKDIKSIGKVGKHNVYSWTWNEKANKLGLHGQAKGVLAQEVQKVQPSAVVNQNGYLAVRYDRLNKE